MITFAIFHVSLPESQRTVPYARDSNIEFVEMLNLAFQSAELYHSNCEKVILTDEHTQFPGLPTNVRLLRRPLDLGKTMFERTRSQYEFIHNHHGRSHVLMMDSDMLICDCLESLFSNGMQLGLTYRDLSDMPINGGLIAVSQAGRQAGATLLRRLVEIMESQYSHTLGWYCDQHALIEAVGRQAFTQRTSDILELEGIGKIALWPCETHNYSPPNKLRKILHHNPARKIIHFKGPRKRLMHDYWRTHLEPRRSVISYGTNWLSLLARTGVDGIVRRLQRAA